jgi:hypothetical protein
MCALTADGGQTLESRIICRPASALGWRHLPCHNQTETRPHGASRCIGAAIRRCRQKWAITYARGGGAAAQVVKEIENAGGKGIAIQADATDAKAVQRRFVARV